MIFKKPYAFIIRHIKIIHAIILLGIGFLLYKTSQISAVYSEVTKTRTIIGKSYSGEIYNLYMYLILIVCLIAAVSILILLIKKEKRFIFYLALTILFAWMLIFYILSYGNMKTMQKNDVSAPVYMAYNDVSQMLFYTQSAFVLAMLLKTTGFDVKTFTFGNNTYGVDISDADEEEIEFSIEIDGNEIKTKRNRKLRNLKYYYLENRWKINSVVFLTTMIVVILIQVFIASKRPVYYLPGSEVSSQNYNLIVDKIYLSNTDYNSKKINSEGVFAILEFKLKKNFDKEYTFDSSNISIIVNDKTYYANSKNYEYFNDLGIAYKEQQLTQEYTDYYLVYQIPYEFSTEDIYVKIKGDFNWEENKYYYYKIKTTYERLDLEEMVTKESKLHDEMIIDAYGIKGNVTINDVIFKEKFKIISNAQIGEKTYSLTEYITPTAEDNDEKAIMMINYEEKTGTNNTSFAELLSNYAIIEYDKDNKKEEAKIYSYITPSLSKEPNVYYVQVSKKILEGTNRVIKIKMRNHIYEYKLD